MVVQPEQLALDPREICLGDPTLAHDLVNTLLLRANVWLNKGLQLLPSLELFLNLAPKVFEKSCTVLHCMHQVPHSVLHISLSRGRAATSRGTADGGAGCAGARAGRAHAQLQTSSM